MRPVIRRLAVFLAVALLVVGCASSGAASLGPGSSPAPSAGAASPAPAPSLEPVTDAEDAVARVVAFDPRLTGIMPLDPDFIGQSSWYEVSRVEGGYRVDVTIGWGDCPAGCIDRHTWSYLVADDGRVALVDEEGEPVPSSEWPSPAGTGKTGLLIRTVAGPTCPVERPDDPTCLPRPVPAANLVVTDPAGNEVARAVTDGGGAIFVELPAGEYEVVARPIEGYVAFPEPIDVVVTEGETPVELLYDTGIR